MKAILIGNDYKDTQYKLEGPKQDIILMKKALTKFCGIRDYVILQNSTKEQIISNIRSCVSEINNSSNDKKLIFYYSGHGTKYMDANESDGNGEGILCSDLNLLLDDELNSLFSKLHHDKTLISIFDCCHSKTMLDYRETNNEINCNVVSIGACRDDSYSHSVLFKNNKWGGIFTRAFVYSLGYYKNNSISKILTNVDKMIQKTNIQQKTQVVMSHPNLNSLFQTRYRFYWTREILTIKHIIRVYRSRYRKTRFPIFIRLMRLYRQRYRDLVYI